ncbi:MAG: hypothetical protein LC789_03230 [Actinobacteria bacterium]|nr:hypothetical protein [Actinomycetota bacterium]MCA1719872.1 hypothetical protein [Actinomycetota bacterium]
MRTRVAVVLAAAAVSSLSLFSPAEATHSWNNYHWARTSNPFTLQVGNNLDASWAVYYNTSNTDWSKSSLLDLAPVAGLTTPRKCRATAGRVEVCNAAYGNNGWLGVASISISGGEHITQGTAKMNDTYFNTSTYNNPNEKLHVMCQEVGHTFGLGHTSENGSSQNTCMDYFSNTGLNATSAASTHPNAHDYEELGIIYTHTDSSTTVASATATTGHDVGTDRASWGREVARGAHGEFSVFERDFGDGQKVITHVTWATR